MTQLEKLKEMNDRESAEFIVEHGMCSLCLNHHTQLCKTDSLEKCKEGVKAWLNSEVEE